jgi:hypothetical protein
MDVDEDPEDEELPQVKLEELLDELQQVTIKDDDMYERDEDEGNWRAEDFNPAASYEVQTGRGLRNQNVNAPNRDGGFDDDDDVNGF